MKYIDKPWGYEEILETNPNYTVKKLFMKKGNQCSYQYHEKKRETIVALEGQLHIILENETVVLKPFESITLEPLVKHRMRAKEENCLYLECSTSELDDIVRIHDDYGRM
ncbi:cupin domain-containing protein [Candidatus Peregrinibacteria bacterium]|nr:cupin domain-containing protein [Candidatus Peregrinibacteria bacterium]